MDRAADDQTTIYIRLNCDAECPNQLHGQFKGTELIVTYPPPGVTSQSRVTESFMTRIRVLLHHQGKLDVRGYRKEKETSGQGKIWRRLWWRSEALELGSFRAHEKTSL